jgi:alkylation response protein AidB-like acyl-CoA dehydrogenase
MDFALNDDQAAIQAAARTFAAAELAPHSARWDADREFPVETLRAAAALGFAGLYVREDVGGSGLGRLDAALVFEELSRGDVSVAAYISIHNMVSWMIDRFGDDAQRHRWLPRLATMELLSSYCLTEPGAGSDAASLSTRAVRDGDWKLVAKAGKPWELYDIAKDRSERRDLAAEQPERVKAMAAQWDEYAARCDVLPLGAWKGKGGK